MPLLLIVAEITLVYLFIQAFGFLNFFLFYAVSMALGIFVVKQVGAKSLRDFQTGQVSSANRALISRGLLFLAGLLMIVPSLWAKSIGLLLLVPPVRWLAAMIFTGFLLKRVFGSGSMIHQFNNGTGGFNFYYKSTGPNPFQDNPFQNQQRRSEFDDGTHDVIDANFRKIEDDPKLLK